MSQQYIVEGYSAPLGGEYSLALQRFQHSIRNISFI